MDSRIGTLPNGKLDLTPIEDEMRELWKTATPPDIAEYYGVDVSRIRNFANSREFGPPYRPPESAGGMSLYEYMDRNGRPMMFDRSWPEGALFEDHPDADKDVEPRLGYLPTHRMKPARAFVRSSALLCFEAR